MLGKSKFRFSFLRFPLLQYKCQCLRFAAFPRIPLRSCHSLHKKTCTADIWKHPASSHNRNRNVSVLILHMIAVKRIKINLILRRIFLRHSRCKRLASRHQHQQNPQTSAITRFLITLSPSFSTIFFPNKIKNNNFPNIMAFFSDVRKLSRSVYK